jgi:hypothetical protein
MSCNHNCNCSCGFWGGFWCAVFFMVIFVISPMAKLVNEKQDAMNVTVVERKADAK